MTPLEATRLYTALRINGFHTEQPQTGEWIVAAATFAPGLCALAYDGSGPDRFFTAPSLLRVAEALRREGAREAAPGAAPPPPFEGAGVFTVERDAGLHALVRRIFQLAASLPPTPWDEFVELTRTMPATTETERREIVRVGQDVFRKSLDDYWDHRCAITGLDQRELLRASHIKPWAACEDSPKERLDPFNGLLLAADLDAAFDAGLISIDPGGRVIVSPRATEKARARFAGLVMERRERLTPAHEGYLRWHRERVLLR